MILIVSYFPYTKNRQSFNPLIPKYHIAIGQEDDTYHAVIFSLADNKKAQADSKTLSTVLINAKRLVMKKEEQLLKFPDPPEEKSNIILPNGQVTDGTIVHP